jgi:hypothetical protein
VPPAWLMGARSRQLGAAARAVAGRPDLWVTAAGTARRLAPRRWWTRFPPWPVPDRRYLGFRMETAYGDPDAVPPPEDVVAYLEWCRRRGGAGRYRWRR